MRKIGPKSAQNVRIVPPRLENQARSNKRSNDARKKKKKRVSDALFKLPLALASAARAIYAYRIWAKGYEVGYAVTRP